MCCRVPRNLGRETCEKRIAFHVTRYCAARISKMELIHLYVLKLLYLFCIIRLSNKHLLRGAYPCPLLCHSGAIAAVGDQILLIPGAPAVHQESHIVSDPPVSEPLQRSVHMEVLK